MRNFVAILIVSAIGIGCGSQSIPTAAMEGTTATITLPNYWSAGMHWGYGRAWSGKVLSAPTPTDPANAPGFSANPFEDLQRGETILTLMDNGTPITRLPVRYITRVLADPASQTGLETLGSQVIVAFDIPPGIVPDLPSDPSDPVGERNLEIKMEVYRRNTTVTGFPFELIDVTDFDGVPGSSIGWGSVQAGPINQTIPIKVIDNPLPDASEPTANANFTPREGWVITGTQANGYLMSLTGGFEGVLVDSVPHPSFRFTTSGWVNPAAMEFELTFPSHRMRVLGVTLARGLPSDAYLDWSVNQSAIGTCFPLTGTLSVKIADRAALTRGITVAFEMEDIGYQGCSHPIVATDITLNLANSVAYNLNGVAVPFPAMTVTGFF